MLARDASPAAGARRPRATAVGQAPELRPYSPPRLVSYGDIRDVTLGPSPGGAESGGFFVSFLFNEYEDLP